MKLRYVVSVPSSSLMHHVARLKPLVPQHSWRMTIFKMLSPRHVVILYRDKRQFAFSFKNEPRPNFIQGLAESGRCDRHRIEINPVCLSQFNQFSQQSNIRQCLPASPDIPRFIDNERSYPEAMALSHDISYALQSSRHVPIEIELISIISANTRVRMPQDQIVETTKVRPRLLEKFSDPVLAQLMIKKSGVTQHHEATG